MRGSGTSVGTKLQLRPWLVRRAHFHPIVSGSLVSGGDSVRESFAADCYGVFIGPASGSA
jgi:hypothetical protein